MLFIELLTKVIGAILEDGLRLLDASNRLTTYIDRILIKNVLSLCSIILYTFTSPVPQQSTLVICEHFIQ